MPYIYILYMVTFTINKNPKCQHQSTIHTDQFFFSHWSLGPKLGVPDPQGTSVLKFPVLAFPVWDQVLDHSNDQSSPELDPLGPLAGASSWHWVYLMIVTNLPKNQLSKMKCVYIYIYMSYRQNDRNTKVLGSGLGMSNLRKNLHNRQRTTHFGHVHCWQ